MNPEQPADGSEWAHVFAVVSEAHRFMHGRKWLEARGRVNRAIAMLRGMELPKPRSDHAMTWLRSWFTSKFGSSDVIHLAGGRRRPGSMELAVAHIYVHAAMTCIAGRSALSTSRPAPQPLAALIVLSRCRVWLAAGLALHDR